MNTKKMNKKLRGKMIYARVRKSKLYLKYRVNNCLGDDIEFTEMLLRYRTEKEEYKDEYRFPVKCCKKDKKYLYFKTEIDLCSINFRPIYWDLRLIAFYEEREFFIHLRNPSYLNFAKYCSLFFVNQYEFGDGMFVYPYVSANKQICLQYREKGEYDDYRIKLKERLAIIRLILTYPWLRYKKIFLVFEKFSNMAQDNGYYFFKYCMENNMEKKMGRSIYYVIDKNSPEREKLAPFKKNVIDFMSVRHITYTLAARLLVSTDAKAHIYPWRRKGSMLIPFIKRRKLVFLQHGVTAMKRVDHFYGKGKAGASNMFVATSEFEKKIIMENFKYKDHEVAVTGFARWDVLKDKSMNSREILVVPTWRNWLEGTTDEIFRESDYYKNYMKLLQSEKLHQLLEKYDLSLNFYLHTKFKNYLKEFNLNAERIKLISFGEEPLNEMLMRCKMVVTDYSSVSWDAFYMKKPVVFYQFDYDDYMNMHGSYIDMETSLFGERTTDFEELFPWIEEYAKKDFAMHPWYEEKHDYYFKYSDNLNTQRICEQILKMGW